MIGSYACNNKNETITDNMFINCYVAKDSVFNDNYESPYQERNATIPLYNNKYVFIYDAPTLANDGNIEIKFYDLSQNKVLGTYAKVDSGTKDNNGVFSLFSTNDANIIAKLKTGKYGVINIDADKASVTYKFNYESLERYGNYYLAQKENDKWVILYSLNDTSFEFRNKIMDDNNDYVVLKDDDEVMIYPNKDNARAINTNSYDYIGLYSKIYAAVDSKNRLWLYTYDNSNSINREGIRLDTKEYYNTANPAFKLVVRSNEVEVSIYDGSKYKVYDTYKIGTSVEEEE